MQLLPLQVSFVAGFYYHSDYIIFLLSSAFTRKKTGKILLIKFRNAISTGFILFAGVFLDGLS
jgi:hypothetical protein